MKDLTLSEDLAKLAKEKGFVDHSKSPDNIPQHCTLAQLQTWLRDDEKVMVWVEPIGADNNDMVLWTYKIIYWYKNNATIDGNIRLSYRGALERGLTIALSHS